WGGVIGSHQLKPKPGATTDRLADLSVAVDHHDITVSKPSVGLSTARNPTSVLRFAKHGPCPSSDPASAFGSRTVAHAGRSLTKDEGVDPHFSPARVARRGDLCRIRGLELNRRGNANGRVGGYGTRDLLQRGYWGRPHGFDVL